VTGSTKVEPEVLATWIASWTVTRQLSCGALSERVLSYQSAPHLTAELCRLLSRLTADGVECTCVRGTNCVNGLVVRLALWPSTQLDLLHPPDDVLGPVGPQTRPKPR
jgi:hypothetical protein